MNGWQIFVEVPGHAPVELKGGESIIGRSRTSQVHVNDSTVSRHHARLLVGSLGDVAVEDLGSSNGTYVNGEKIEGRRKLADGDRVLIGDAELRLRITAPVAASEATVRMVLPPLGPPPAAPPPPASAPPPPAPIAAAPPPPLRPAPGLPPVTMPFPQPPAAAPARSWASAPAPVRTIDPPLHPEPVTRPAPPRPAKAAAAPAAAAAAPAAPATVTPPAPGRRGDVLPSVTVIDRIPIPEPGPEARDRARLARARPAGFWVRFVALLVDSALIAVAGVGVSVASLVLPGSAAIKIPVIYGIVTGLSLAYLLVFWAIRGATPGKMVMGLAVVAADTKIGSGIGWGPAILRALGYVASSVIFGIGFLLVAFTSQKQGLHDLIAGTRVLRLR